MSLPTKRAVGKARHCHSGETEHIKERWSLQHRATGASAAQSTEEGAYKRLRNTLFARTLTSQLGNWVEMKAWWWEALERWARRKRVSPGCSEPVPARVSAPTEEGLQLWVTGLSSAHHGRQGSPRGADIWAGRPGMSGISRPVSGERGIHSGQRNEREGTAQGGGESAHPATTQELRGGVVFRVGDGLGWTYKAKRVWEYF